MRHFTVATAMAVAMAAMFAMTAAKAEIGGPIRNDQGQCRSYGPNNTNLTYSYWGACPGSLQGPHGHVHTIRATAPLRHRHS
jgi:hypothetical protein